MYIIQNSTGRKCHLERDKNRVIYTLGIKIFNSASTRIHTKFRTYAVHDVQQVASSVPCHIISQ